MGIYRTHCEAADVLYSHAMVAIGYGVEKGENYFLLQNSWGDEWGEDGCVKFTCAHDIPGGLCGLYECVYYPYIKNEGAQSVIDARDVSLDVFDEEDLLQFEVDALSNLPTLLTDDIISRYPGLKGGRLWKEHDRLMLPTVMKHGYGIWQVIVGDEELKIQEVICQELNLPSVNTPVPQTQLHPSGSSHTQAFASRVPEPQVPVAGFSQSKDINSENVEAPAEISNEGNGLGATDTSTGTQLSEDQSTCHVREMQRSQADENTNGIPFGEAGGSVRGEANPSSEASDSQTMDQLPQDEIICCIEAKEPEEELD